MNPVIQKLPETIPVVHVVSSEGVRPYPIDCILVQLAIENLAKGYAAILELFEKE